MQCQQLSTLDLSNNNLGLNGAKMMSKVAYKMNNIWSLDLSDNELGDEGIAELAQGFRNNYTMTRLILNRNFKAKTKYRVQAI